MHRILFASVLASGAVMAAERINHEGRILGDQPVVTTPILFNTTAADAIVSTMQIMPRDNPWNEDISARPLLSNSAAMMAVIRGQFSGNRQRAVLFQEMNYVLVPDNQALANINFTLYYGDSDFNGGTSPIGRYPIPANQPVEGWPDGVNDLATYQRMTGGDRHTITVQPGNGNYFETWLSVLTNNTPAWEASNGALFHLTSNALRTPDGIGSGDAAGLPMFPSLVRYDEIQRGVVEHALRLIVKNTRAAHIYPATHHASVPSTTDPNVPAMGQRLRLKSSFVIPSSWSSAERAVGVALKKYGAIMADNGSFCSMSICPDDRWAAGIWDHFQTGAASDFVDINNFEVIQTTDATEGPRSTGAPTAAAGLDQAVTLAAGATLSGSATGSGIVTRWYLYPYATAPGTVVIANPASLSTTATFSANGTYILMLSASDGVHTPAFDAVQITVGAGGTTGGGTTGGGTTSGGTTSGGTTSGTTGGGGSAPTLGVVGVNSVDLTSAIVTWTTNVPATSVVAYGTTSALGQAVSDPALTTSHHVVVSGLSAGTVYHLQVSSADSAGNSASSADVPFVTTTNLSESTGTAGTSTGSGSSGCGQGSTLGVVLLLGAGLSAMHRRHRQQ